MTPESPESPPGSPRIDAKPPTLCEAMRALCYEPLAVVELNSPKSGTRVDWRNWNTGHTFTQWDVQALARLLEVDEWLFDWQHVDGDLGAVYAPERP